MVWSFCNVDVGFQWFGLNVVLSVCFMTWSVVCSRAEGRSVEDLASFRVLVFTIA